MAVAILAGFLSGTLVTWTAMRERTNLRRHKAKQTVTGVNGDIAAQFWINGKGQAAMNEWLDINEMERRTKINEAYDLLERRGR